MSGIRPSLAGRASSANVRGAPRRRPRRCRGAGAGCARSLRLDGHDQRRPLPTSSATIRVVRLGSRRYDDPSSVRNRSTRRSPVVRSTDQPLCPSMRTATGFFAVTSLVVANASTRARAVVGAAPRPRPRDPRSVTELRRSASPRRARARAGRADEFGVRPAVAHGELDRWIERRSTSSGRRRASRRARGSARTPARRRPASLSASASAVGLAVGFAVGFARRLRRSRSGLSSRHPPAPGWRSRRTPPDPCSRPRRPAARPRPSGRRRAGRSPPRPRSRRRRPRPDRRLAWVTRDGRSAAPDAAGPRPEVLARTVGSRQADERFETPAIAAPLEKRDSGSGARAGAPRRRGRPARRRARRAGDGAGLPTRARASWPGVSPRHGRRPVSASYITRPRP